MLGDLLEVSPHHLKPASVAGSGYHTFSAQHEGYYFSLAAKCQEVRWELFKNEFDLATIKNLVVALPPCTSCFFCSVFFNSSYFYS